MRKTTLPIFLLCLISLNAMASNGISTSLYTGGLSYSIPLYTLDDPDFHLDIALRYNSKGFKPFQPSGCYGQGWTLVAGGYVARTVQGIADEWIYSYDIPGGDAYTKYGFLRTSDLFGINEDPLPDKELVYDFNPSVYDTCGIYTPSIWRCCKFCKVDYLPDIFYFNFCGHKGSFMIDNSEKPVILNGDFVHVDISETKTNANNECDTKNKPDHNSRITIKTTDGYTYIFGGTIESLEYSVYSKRNALVSQNTPTISAWHLTKIIAPNGRSITLNYSSGTTQNWYWLNSLMSFITDYDWTEPDNGDTTHIVYSLHKECLLQSIITSDSTPLKIQFYAHQESAPMYENTDITYCTRHTQLDSIVVTYDNQVLRKAQMAYLKRSYIISQVFGSPEPDFNWRYLSQVNISGIGIYTLTYKYFDPYPPDTITTYPPMIVYHLHWYPNLSPRTDDDYKRTVDRFGFWTVSAMQGMLEEVSLPTGGKLNFTYEDHQYGEERRYRVAGNQDVELYSLSATNQTIGGVRIKKVETYSDANTLVETQTFSYNKQGTNLSSGIYYNTYEVFYPSNPNHGYPIAYPDNYGLMDSHIGYSYVEKTTTIGNDTYKTAYTFDTGRSSYSSVGNNLVHRNPAATGVDSVELRSGSLMFDGWLVAPGKLLKTEQYTGNALTKSVQYKYNGICETSFGPLSFGNNSLGCPDTIVCLSKYSAHIARKLLVCPNVLEQVVTSKYGTDGQPMVSTTDYTYDSKLRKKSVSSTDSRGIQHFTKYTYLDEFPSVSSSVPHPFFFLYQTNRIGNPVETISGYIKNNTEYITTGTVNIYANNTYTSGDGMTFSPYLYQTLSLSLLQPIEDYQPLGFSNGQVTYDSRYFVQFQYGFDRMHRLIFIKPFGEMETTYSWNGLYPATKTIGNQIWAYTYLPYVGINSITDPRGITSYFSYDAAGRIVEEYQLVDGQKQIINFYHYHIKTE